MTDLTDRLDEIEARADAATEGPWDTSTTSWEPEARMVDVPDGDDEMSLAWEAGGGLCVMSRADAEFVADARSFVPKALAALDAVLAMHAPSKEPTSGHYYCDSDECDRAGEGELRDACQHCGHWFPCPTIAAIEQALS